MRAPDRRPWRLSLVVAWAVVVGCVEPAGVDRSATRAGVLQLVGYQGVVTTRSDEAVRWTVPPDASVLVPARLLAVPDTVGGGETFEVAVTTLGPSGCWAAGGQALDERDGVIELTPLDTHSGAGICTEVLLELEHRCALAIATPGEWTVRVRGRRARMGDATWEEPVAAEKMVVVR